MKRSRSQVLQGILDTFENPNYLEIGVCKGKTFFDLTAARKIAVDPDFRFSVADAEVREPHSSFHALTSDDYFAQCGRNELFDVIYLDGLHVFEQTLRDLMNALGHVHTKSVIVVDDVYPSGYAASIADRGVSRAVRDSTPGMLREWMGDVYKTVFFVETFLQNWSYNCITDVHGQLIMWQSPRASVNERLIEDIGKSQYSDVVLNKDSFKFRDYEEILADIASRG